MSEEEWKELIETYRGGCDAYLDNPFYAKNGLPRNMKSLLQRIDSGERTEELAEVLKRINATF